MTSMFQKPLLATALAITAIGYGAVGNAQLAAETVSDPALESVLADPHRDEDRARDQYRHPAETLAFFDIKPNQTLIEFAPGGGWYTRILAPYLAKNGQYIAVNSGDYGSRPRPADYVPFDESFPETASIYTGVPAKNIAAYTADSLPEALDGSIDRILIVRMMHNMLRSRTLGLDLKALRKVLKDDGMIGIVQHMAPEGAPYSVTDGSKGYLQKSDVIALMAVYGFELVDESFINVNPMDTTDYPDGVWTLPPTYRLGDKNRARYQAIGESNRMTLLFRKAQ